MRNCFLIFTLLLAAIGVRAADYSAYYSGLPVELRQVEPISFPELRVSLTDFGAKGDGVVLNTQAFADAIAHLSAKGGGVLDIPAGVWLTGPIELKSNICLNLDKNAIVQFSPDHTLYVDPSPKASRVLPCITAERCTNIGITGSGIIDGSGAAWRPVKRGKVSDTEWKLFLARGGVERQQGKLWYPWQSKAGYADIAETPERQEKMRNDLFRVFHCKGILLTGVTFQNAPKFHVHPFNSDNVIIDGITVRAPWNAQNADAIDISDCHRVLIVNSTIDAGDDGFCIKSGESKPKALVNGCEDILVRYCTAYHGHGGFVFGSETISGMTRVVCADCRFSGTDTGLRFKSAIGRGGATKDVYVERVVMNDIISDAIVFECQYADRPAGSSDKTAAEPKPLVNVPHFKDIHISDIVCRGCRVGVAASGIDGQKCVEDINISNSTFVYSGEATQINTSNASLTLTDVEFVKEGPAQNR